MYMQLQLKLTSLSSIQQVQKRDSITTKNAFHIDVTADGETMAAGEERYYKLFVWFEGQDAKCTDANSGQKIPGLKFEVSSELVSD